jgi:hypothetical protein
MDSENSMTAAEELLRKTIAAVDQRRQTYGPPGQHFARTVGMINALFAHKLKVPLTVEEWAQIMVLDKLARHQERPIEDNPLDVAGYAACWFECSSRR